MYKSAGFKISKNKSMNQHMYTMILHESTSPATVEYTYDFARENVYSDDVMRYKLSLMDETAFENFMIYLKSLNCDLTGKETSLLPEESLINLTLFLRIL